MTLTNEQVENIKSEFNQWKDKMYANKTLSERQDFGQFFTPPELTVKMLEKFNDLDGSVLDPTCGAGNLLAAAIVAGADPKLIYGIELDPEILEIARSRLEVLGLRSTCIKAMRFMKNATTLVMITIMKKQLQRLKSGLLHQNFQLQDLLIFSKNN